MKKIFLLSLMFGSALFANQNNNVNSQEYVKYHPAQMPPAPLPPAPFPESPVHFAQVQAPLPPAPYHFPVRNDVRDNPFDQAQAQMPPAPLHESPVHFAQVQQPLPPAPFPESPVHFAQVQAPFHPEPPVFKTNVPGGEPVDFFKGPFLKENISGGEPLPPAPVRNDVRDNPFLLVGNLQGFSSIEQKLQKFRKIVKELEYQSSDYYIKSLNSIVKMDKENLGYNTLVQIIRYGCPELLNVFINKFGNDYKGFAKICTNSDDPFAPGENNILLELSKVQHDYVWSMFNMIDDYFKNSGSEEYKNFVFHMGNVKMYDFKSVFDIAKDNNSLVYYLLNNYHK